MHVYVCVAVAGSREGCRPGMKGLSEGLTMARAMAMRCFCPPESCPPNRPQSVAYPSGNSEIKP